MAMNVTAAIAAGYTGCAWEDLPPYLVIAGEVHSTSPVAGWSVHNAAHRAALKDTQSVPRKPNGAPFLTIEHIAKKADKYKYAEAVANPKAMAALRKRVQRSLDRLRGKPNASGLAYWPPLIEGEASRSHRAENAAGWVRQAVAYTVTMAEDATLVQVPKSVKAAAAHHWAPGQTWACETSCTCGNASQEAPPMDMGVHSGEPVDNADCAVNVPSPMDTHVHSPMDMGVHVDFSTYLSTTSVSYGDGFTGAVQNDSYTENAGGEASVVAAPPQHEPASPVRPEMIIENAGNATGQPTGWTSTDADEPTAPSGSKAGFDDEGVATFAGTATDSTGAAQAPREKVRDLTGAEVKVAKAALGAYGKTLAGFPNVYYACVREAADAGFGLDLIAAEFKAIAADEVPHLSKDLMLSRLSGKVAVQVKRQEAVERAVTGYVSPVALTADGQPGLWDPETGERGAWWIGVTFPDENPLEGHPWQYEPMTYVQRAQQVMNEAGVTDEHMARWITAAVRCWGPEYVPPVTLTPESAAAHWAGREYLDRRGKVWVREVRATRPANWADMVAAAASTA